MFCTLARQQESRFCDFHSPELPHLQDRYETATFPSSHVGSHSFSALNSDSEKLNYGTDG